MPLLTIHHKTVYRYTRPVAFGEHRIMLRPRDGHDLRVLASNLKIEPEPMQFRMEEKRTGLVAASLVLWEMENYSWRWNYPAAGVIGSFVRPEFRRQGMGKYLFAHVLRYLQEQFFGVVEAQCPQANEPAAALFRSLGFEAIDVGRTYRKEVTSNS